MRKMLAVLLLGIVIAFAAAPVLAHGGGGARMIETGPETAVHDHDRPVN